MPQPRYTKVTLDDFREWAKKHDWLMIDAVDEEEYHRANFLTPSGETIVITFTNGNAHVAKCAAWKM